MEWDHGAEGFKQRGSERIPVDAITDMRPDNRFRVEVKIRDVSSTGFMAECHETVGIGSIVSLDVPGIGPVQAQVRWQLGGAMGGLFHDPISLSDCEWTARPVDPKRAAA